MSSQYQTHFISSISHELKNQLAGILSLSEMIKGEFFGRFGDEKHKKEYLEAAADINNVANDMLEFVNDLMDVEENQLTQFTIKKEQVDIASLIKKVIKLNQPYALSKNIQIVFGDNGKNLLSSLQIFLDTKRTKQILTNLISNSIKYSPKNTTITIGIKIIEEDKTTNNNKLIISICDQGIGMNDEQIKMALDGKGAQIDKFFMQNKPDDKSENHHYQTHTTQKPTTTNQTQSHEQTQSQTQWPTYNQLLFNSHGIGMPLVKQLVEAQNGTMEIKSKIGSGTKINLYFMI
jgi:signal transduction histidine kinase